MDRRGEIFVTEQATLPNGGTPVQYCNSRARCFARCAVRRSPVRDDIMPCYALWRVVRRMANHNDNQLRPVRGSKQRKRKRRVEANARGPFGYSHAPPLDGNRAAMAVARGERYRLSGPPAAPRRRPRRGRPGGNVLNEATGRTGTGLQNTGTTGTTPPRRSRFARSCSVRSTTGVTSIE